MNNSSHSLSTFSCVRLHFEVSRISLSPDRAGEFSCVGEYKQHLRLQRMAFVSYAPFVSNSFFVLNELLDSQKLFPSGQELCCHMTTKMDIL